LPFAGFEDFDACMAHMTKPKDQGGGGYDEETARKVCGKLQAQSEGKEGFRWLGDVTITDVPKKNLVKFKALHPIKTYHPETWPSVREYLEDELIRSARTMKDKPLGSDHERQIPEPYKVLDAEYEDGAIEGVAYAPDDIVQKIRDGKIKHCSVEYNWRSLEKVDGVAPKGIVFSRLDFLEKYQPGDSLTMLQPWEAIIKDLKEAAAKTPAFPLHSVALVNDIKIDGKEYITPGEYILGFYRDPYAFLPEHFSSIWLDHSEGILALVSRLRDQPESRRIQSVLFSKEKMWDENRIRDWFLLHPQYLVEGLSSNNSEGVNKMGGKEGENPSGSAKGQKAEEEPQKGEGIAEKETSSPEEDKSIPIEEGSELTEVKKEIEALKGQVEVLTQQNKELQEALAKVKQGKSLGEAIVEPPGLTQPTLAERIRRHLPERVPRHWGFGPYDVIRKIKKELESESLVDRH